MPVFLANTQLATIESPLPLFFTLTIYLFMIALQRGSRNYFLGAAVAVQSPPSPCGRGIVS
jgi:4-amino-4-deoxy-L-arabinose transferase-like glycosyltransferase